MSSDTTMSTASLQSLLPADLDTVAVSLDLESTLAHCHEYFIQQYNSEFGTSYVRDDIDDWDWVREEIEFEDFNRIVNDGWRNCHTEIAVMEPGLADLVARMHDHPRIEVDIVTARTGVEDGMQAWLAANGITEYGEFIATTTSKAQLDYNVYIDDRPGLANDLPHGKMQYLIQGPHN
jgi:hypothetical protein